MGTVKTAPAANSSGRVAVALHSCWLLTICLCLAVPAHAQSNVNNELLPETGVSELREFSSLQLRSRYYALLNQLRCPKCQNQNLADSDAPIAADLRNELYSLLEEGYSDTEIREFMTARYGTFVLYQPPLTQYTLALWLLPPVLLAIAAGLVWRASAASRAAGNAGTSKPGDSSEQ
ncbi:MAG: cytochrome c-type biogenesis protein CcmH [Pseudomonadales bacterium]|nr:cytochrome c-type biogenesis protein CcmH [Pseudomonadales bacterium]